MENHFFSIFKIFDGVDELTRLNSPENMTEDDRAALFIYLLHVEAFLDHSRALLPPGSSSEFPDDMKTVNKRLDDLRDVIRFLRDSLTDKTAEDVLYSAGEQFKLSYRS